MDNDYTEYHSRLLIDRHTLDTEVAEQPSLFYAVAQLTEDTRDEMEAAKENLQRVDSTTATELRTKADRDNTKLTEGKLAEQVLVSADHAQAYKEAEEARGRYARTNALREAFSQRASMLKLMVDLYMGQYFAVGAVRCGTMGQRADAAASTGRHAMAAKRTPVKGAKS